MDHVLAHFLALLVPLLGDGCLLLEGVRRVALEVLEVAERERGPQLLLIEAHVVVLLRGVQHQAVDPHRGHFQLDDVVVDQRGLEVFGFHVLFEA